MKQTHNEIASTLRRTAARALAVWMLGALAAAAQETNRPAVAGPADADALRLIRQRNIFDPNRAAPRAEGRSSTSRVVEAFALVGTLSYGKGDFAFFDGTASDYRRAFCATGALAGFTVTGITATGVTMEADARRIEMKVGAQMRRDAEGAWQLEAGAEWPPASAGTNAPPPSAGEANEVLRKLMQQREQELK